MKSILLILISTLILFSLAFFWWKNASSPPGNDSSFHQLIIPKGASAAQIADNLEKEGFVRSALAFKIYVQTRGQAGKIQAGDYRLAKNLPLPGLVNELVRGPIAVWVTLQEGLRREEMAEKIVNSLGLSPDKKEGFRGEFLSLTKNSEGYLFPDTYLFLRNSTPQAIMKRLTETFEAKVTSDIKGGAEEQNLTLAQMITLASIIERETRTEEERPTVAGILLRRLWANWPLQADATLQYAVSDVRCQVSSIRCEWWPKITTEDKQIKSPYNTYINRGLPPTPIASPGLASIKAIANPTQTEYWFYLHEKNGQIHYAQTAQEHGENVRKYLQ